MRVTRGEHSDLEAPAKAEPADDVLWRDYYTRLPQIRLTGDQTGPSETEIMLDRNDVASLVECAIRHPNPNMPLAVLVAIWNHPDSFRQILRFGLNASPGFPEIRKIVGEELDKHSPLVEPASNRARPTVDTLLPRTPLPAHLKGRGKR